MKKIARFDTEVLFACHMRWVEMCYNVTSILFVPLDSSSSSSSSELLRNVNRCESIGSRQHGVTGLAGETAGAPKARAPSPSIALFLLYYCERPEEQCNIKRALAGRSEPSESSILPWPFTSARSDTLEHAALRRWTAGGGGGRGRQMNIYGGRFKGRRGFCQLTQAW